MKINTLKPVTLKYITQFSFSVILICPEYSVNVRISDVGVLNFDRIIKENLYEMCQNVRIVKVENYFD